MMDREHPNNPSRNGPRLAMQIRQSCARLLALGILTIALASCGDPGTGGSGLPTGSPVVVSPPALNTGAGRVEAVSSDEVTIGGVRYLVGEAEVQLADGSAATFSALKLGQQVLVSVLSSVAPLRWRLVIQGQ
jgi:hypothetical protein